MPPSKKKDEKDLVSSNDIIEATKSKEANTPFDALGLSLRSANKKPKEDNKNKPSGFLKAVNSLARKTGDALIDSSFENTLERGIDIAANTNVAKAIINRINRDKDKQNSVRSRAIYKQKVGLNLTPEEKQRLEVDDFLDVTKPGRDEVSIIKDIDSGNIPEGVTPDEIIADARNNPLLINDYFRNTSIYDTEPEINPIDIAIAGGLGVYAGATGKAVTALGQAGLDAGFEFMMPIVNAASDVIQGDKELGEQLAVETGMRSAIGGLTAFTIGYGIGKTSELFFGTATLKDAPDIDSAANEILESTYESIAKASKTNDAVIDALDNARPVSFGQADTAGTNTIEFNDFIDPDTGQSSVLGEFTPPRTPKVDPDLTPFQAPKLGEKNLPESIKGTTDPQAPDKNFVEPKSRANPILARQVEEIPEEKAKTFKKFISGGDHSKKLHKERSKWNPVEIASRLTGAIQRNLVDPSYDLRKELKKFGEIGENLLDRQSTSRNANSIASIHIKEAEKKVFSKVKGVYSSHADNFNSYLRARSIRGIKSIESRIVRNLNRKNAANQGLFDVSNFKIKEITRELDLDEAQEVIDIFEGDTKYGALYKELADNLYAQVRKMVDDMYNAKLISKEQHRDWTQIDYLPTEYILDEIDPIQPIETAKILGIDLGRFGGTKLGTVRRLSGKSVETVIKKPATRKITVTDSGIRKLKGGMEGEVFQDHEVLFNELAESVYTRISQNIANAELLKFAGDTGGRVNGQLFATTRKQEFDRILTQLGLYRDKDGTIKGWRNLEPEAIDQTLKQYQKLKKKYNLREIDPDDMPSTIREKFLKEDSNITTPGINAFLAMEQTFTKIGFADIDKLSDEAIKELTTLGVNKQSMLKNLLIRNINEQVDDILKDTVPISYRMGEKNLNIYMDKDLADQWVTKADTHVNSLALKTLGMLTQADTVKTFAVGVNPAFSIRNYVRDFIPAIINSHQYNALLPIAVIQLKKDIGSVTKDVLSESGWLLRYKQAGGLSNTFTRLSRSDTALSGVAKEMQDVFGKPGEVTEMLVRTAVFKRGIENGLSPERAARVANEYIDFSNVAPITRVLDKVFPFYSARTAAIRDTLRAVGRKPALVSFQIAQVASFGLGLYALGSRVYKHYYDKINSIDKQNNYIVPLPFMLKDEHGNPEPAFWAFPKDETTKPFTNTFEVMHDWVMYGEKPTKESIDFIKSSFSGLSTNIPTLSAWRAMVDNYDDYFDSEVWRGEYGEDNVFEYMKHDENTNQLFIDIGKQLDLPPKQMERATQKILANNMLTDSMMQGYELLHEQKDINGFSELDKMWQQEIDKRPILKNFIVRPTDYDQKQFERDDKIEQREGSRKLLQKRKIAAYAQQAQAGNLEAIVEYKKWFDTQLPTEHSNIKNRFQMEYILASKGYQKLPRKDELYRLSRTSNPIERANKLFDRLVQYNDKGREEMLQSLRIWDQELAKNTPFRTVLTERTWEQFRFKVKEYNEKNPEDAIGR